MSRTREFKVYATADKKFFVRVVVKPSQRTLVREYNRNRHNDIMTVDGGLCAFFRPYTVYFFKKAAKGEKSKGKLTGELGEMIFNGENLDLDTVAHECGHVAHAFCRRKRKTRYQVISHEEIYCWVLGSLVDQTVRWFLEHGYEFRGTE